MKKEKVLLTPLKLIGLTIRTNNKQEMEPKTSKIAYLAQDYWQNAIGNEFKHRVNPGTTYAVYTEYDSDETGDYTYFIGEAVHSFKEQDLSRFKSLSIPQQHYQKFTTKAGQIPKVVIEAWQAIWQMSPQNLEGHRNYLVDFEVFDQRAKDPNKAVIDIYIGVTD